MQFDSDQSDPTTIIITNTPPLDFVDERPYTSPLEIALPVIVGTRTIIGITSPTFDSVVITFDGDVAPNIADRALWEADYGTGGLAATGGSVTAANKVTINFPDDGDFPDFLFLQDTTTMVFAGARGYAGATTFPVPYP